MSFAGNLSTHGCCSWVLLSIGNSGAKNGGTVPSKTIFWVYIIVYPLKNRPKKGGLMVAISNQSVPAVAIDIGYILDYITIYHIWLPGWWYTYPLKNYESQLGWLFPPEWKVIQNSMVPVTTNQSYIVITIGKWCLPWENHRKTIGKISNITSYWVYTTRSALLSAARDTRDTRGAPGAPTSPLRPRRRHPRRRSPRWPLQEKHGRNWPMNLMVTLW